MIVQFRAHCEELSKRNYDDAKDSKIYRGIFDDVKNIPCYADFFRYVQWHNLAFLTTSSLGIPTVIIHYENYTDSFNATKNLLLDFLEQEEVRKPKPFVTGKTYRGYFTEEEVKAVSAMFSKLAHDTTWDHLQHYFE